MAELESLHNISLYYLYVLIINKQFLSINRLSIIVAISFHFISIYTDRRTRFDQLVSPLRPLHIAQIVTMRFEPQAGSLDQQRYWSRWEERVTHLFSHVSRHFEGITPTALQTDHVSAFRRRIPNDLLSTIRFTTIDDPTIDAWEELGYLFELLALTQHTDLIFAYIDTLDDQFDVSTNDMKILAIRHLWQIEIPFSHHCVYNQLVSLLQDLPWKDCILYLVQLRDAAIGNFFAVEICESYICSLLCENSNALLRSTDHIDFYRSIYDAASCPLRLIMEHNFGRPLGYRSESTVRIPNPLRRKNHVTKSFYRMFQHYEYRISLMSYNAPFLEPKSASIVLHRLQASTHLFSATLLMTEQILTALLQNRETNTIMRLIFTPDNMYDACIIPEATVADLFSQRVGVFDLEELDKSMGEIKNV